MAFYDKFPYTNFQEINLDRIIQQLVEVQEGLQFVIDNESLKYADPIQWNITSQYQANTVVIDPATGIAYLSTRPVPNNILITNTNYWTPIFDLSAIFDEVDTLSEEVNNLSETVTGISSDIENMPEEIKNDIVESVYPRIKYFRPEDYGAVLNDDTFDCSNALKTAINNAISEHGIVLLSNGTYHTQNEINITEHVISMQIIGTGPRARLFTDGGGGTEIYFHGVGNAINFSHGIQNSVIKDLSIRCSNASSICMNLNNDSDPSHISRTTITKIENVRFNYTYSGIVVTNAAYLRIIDCDFAAVFRVTSQKAIYVHTTYTNNEYIFLQNVIIDSYAPATYGDSLSTAGIYLERINHLDMINTDITDSDYAIYMDASYEINFIKADTIDIARCRYGIYGVVNNQAISNCLIGQLVYTACNDAGPNDRIIYINKVAGGYAYAARMICENIIIRTGQTVMDYLIEGAGTAPFGSGTTNFKFKYNGNPAVKYETLQMDADRSTLGQVASSTIDYNDIKFSGMYPATLRSACSNSPGFDAILVVYADHQRCVQIALSLVSTHAMATRVYTLSSNTWSEWRVL